MKWHVAALVLYFAPLAQAADLAGGTSRFDWNSLKEKTDASYALLVLGPTVTHLDGNKDGKGRYISFRNYLSADVEFAKDWEAETGWEFRRHWRAPDPKRPDRKEFETRDPFLGISRKNIIKGDVFSFGARARYALPVSEYNYSKRGKADDAGRGEANVGLSPSWKRGDLFVSCNTDVFYKFDRRAPAIREDYSVRFKPLVSYRIAEKYSAKVEYNSGYLRHNTNGKWTKFNDVATGQKLYAGMSYMPTKELSISPSLAWGSDTFRLDRTELSVFASYYFL